MFLDLSAAQFLVVYIMAVNVAGFILLAHDKRLAEFGEARISELHLLGLAALGGSLGAKLAQMMYRHKTRKQPFGRRLNLIVALHAAISAMLLAPRLGLL